MPPDAPLITDPAALPALAAAHHERFEVTRYQLEAAVDSISDADLDAWVAGIAAPIVAAIDCTQCANCCRALHVYLVPDDLPRLAQGLGQDPAAVDAAYLDHAAAQVEGEWARIVDQPCPLLRGTLCSVYPHRPQSCRDYPVFTPDFRWTQADLIAGATLCPIVFNVLHQVSAGVDTLLYG